MVKGAALFLQQGNSPQGQRSLQHPHKHAGDYGSIHGTSPVPQWVGSHLLGLRAREVVHCGFIMSSTAVGVQRLPMCSLSVN
jgi:hypothetical protein